MKKTLLAVFLIAVAIAPAIAQEKTKVIEDHKKVKKTSSVPQKVHNTFSKHKHYNGTKTTHKKVVEKTNEAPK